MMELDEDYYLVFKQAHQVFFDGFPDETVIRSDAIYLHVEEICDPTADCISPLLLHTTLLLEKNAIYLPNIDRAMISDVSWREYNIHHEEPSGDGNQQHESNEADADEGWSMPLDFFQTDGDEDVMEEITYLIPGENPSRESLTLCCQEDYSSSTGMAIWKGSEILAQYLAKHKHKLCEGKSVVELGAGVGLCGLVAQRLGASKVVWTDGDATVLHNLRANVSRNWKPGTQHAGSDSSAEFLCPQLIWGKDSSKFLQVHGKAQVILGTDLFYMTKSLQPLFETVDQLLDGDEGVFVAVNSCASQSPIEKTLEVATKYGFEWTIDSLSQVKPAVGGEHEEDELIYLFRRGRRS